MPSTSFLDVELHRPHSRLFSGGCRLQLGRLLVELPAWDGCPIMFVDDELPAARARTPAFGMPVKWKAPIGVATFNMIFTGSSGMVPAWVRVTSYLSLPR